jgi:hypothetical protein
MTQYWFAVKRNHLSNDPRWPKCHTLSGILIGSISHFAHFHSRRFFNQTSGEIRPCFIGIKTWKSNQADWMCVRMQQIWRLYFSWSLLEPNLLLPKLNVTRFLKLKFNTFDCLHLSSEQCPSWWYPTSSGDGGEIRNGRRVLLFSERSRRLQIQKISMLCQNPFMGQLPLLCNIADSDNCIEL